MKQLAYILIILGPMLSWAQVKEVEQTMDQANELTSEAFVAMANDDFIDGEAKYRKAISLDPAKAASKYNLGNSYYGKNKNAEAMRRFLQAAEVATTKEEKHKAFHNLGNTFMNEKKYAEAVEAYKNALRSNPTDDETRYNLALAKEMLEKENQNNGGGEDDENEEEKDKNEQEQDQQEQDGDNGDQEDKNDQGEQEEDEKKGEDKEEQGSPDQPEEKKEEQQKPRQGQLSPQQIQNLLEAMNNEEKKVQEKVNAKKQKGAKTKSGKDW